MVLSPDVLASFRPLWPSLSCSFFPKTGKGASHKTNETLIGKAPPMSFEDHKMSSVVEWG